MHAYHWLEVHTASVYSVLTGQASAAAIFGHTARNEVLPLYETPDGVVFLYWVGGDELFLDGLITSYIERFVSS